MKVRAGRLRDRVTLLAPASPDPDSYGEDEAEPTAAGTFWAEVKPLSGREAEAARQLREEASHAVAMRDVGVRITARHSLVWHAHGGDRRLEVVQALQDPADWSWAIVAVETPEDG